MRRLHQHQRRHHRGAEPVQWAPRGKPQGSPLILLLATLLRKQDDLTGEQGIVMMALNPASHEDAALPAQLRGAH